MLNFEKALIEEIKTYSETNFGFKTGSHRLTLIQQSDFKTHIIQFQFKIYKSYDRNDDPTIQFQIEYPFYIDRFGIRQQMWDFKTRSYVFGEFKKFFESKMLKGKKHESSNRSHPCVF